LEEFFPSINFGRVRGFFLKTRDFTLQERVATVIAQIVCHENSLPEGSPCSPIISNLVTHVLDMHLVKLASECGCTYSRYADDLTFSTNKKEFPFQIAVPAETSAGLAHLWLPGESLRQVIERSGFRINSKKTRMMYRDSRQNVTGLVVNKKINVAREYHHNIRAMVHRLVTTGQFEILEASTKDEKVVLGKRPGTLNELHGMLGFIDSVEYHNKTQSHERPVRPSSRESAYRQFLLYSTFYAPTAPVLICEGPTDNVYFTHAIRSLAGELPALVEQVPGGKMRLKIRLYKYTRSNTARLLGLNDGGSSVLGKFIRTYRNETARFAGPGLTEPVIMIYDNDDGANSIRTAINDVSKVKSTRAEAFMHVVRNLYAVPTPLQSGVTSSKVEDFFDSRIKATVIEGKSFHEGNSFDTHKHYGKKVFAHMVIRPNADKVDFSGFRPLLQNIFHAITAHGKSLRTDAPVPKGSPEPK
jgi:RNA-directed DNA polymerase